MSKHWFYVPFGHLFVHAIFFRNMIPFCPARRKPKETEEWQIDIVIRCCYLEWNKSLEICIILTWTTGLSVTKSCFTGTIYSTWTTTNICLSSNGSMPPLDTNATLFWAFGPTTKLGPLTISRCWWSTICAWCIVVFWGVGVRIVYERKVSE